MRGMTVPSGPELLDTWEAGLAASDADRALLLHALARPSLDTSRLLSTPVGARDADLLTLRAVLFGELAQVGSAASAAPRSSSSRWTSVELLTRDGPTEDADEPIQVALGEWTVRFRLPTSADLLAVGQSAPAEARSLLMERCVVAVIRDAQPATAADLPRRGAGKSWQRRWPRPTRTRIYSSTPRARPAATTLPRSSTPASFVWAELDAWARGTLVEVHLLASTYGWTEPEVLSLSPRRRRHYLELAGHA